MCRIEEMADEHRDKRGRDEVALALGSCRNVSRPAIRWRTA